MRICLKTRSLSSLQVLLCTSYGCQSRSKSYPKRRNFVDFDAKIARLHQNPRKWTHLIAIRFLLAIRTMRKNVEIRENLQKSSKILDDYPTKINEKSCFEHVQVTLCKITWFSRPERLWSRSGNTLPQSPKFCGFWPENCSDPSKIHENECIW